MSRFVLMAGGTGGHLFPAEALAQELRRRGHDVHLMTDERVEGIGAAFPAREIHKVPAATPSLRNPIKFAGAAIRIVYGMGVAFKVLRGIDADAVVGFGGYPTFPPLLTASLLGIPSVVHEANAVMGRANRVLARFADYLALGFSPTVHAGALNLETVVTGNPVRDAVREVARHLAYEPLRGRDPIRLLVFGGSQGARVFADLVPPAISLLPDDLRARLVVTQQCRPEDLERVTEAYRQARVTMELAPFFGDLPERMAQSHLVIARAGASTVAELCVLGRPALLVPLPGSLDADQRNNAQVIANAGGGWLVEQDTLSPQSLATRLAGLFTGPEALAAAAEAVAGLGQPDAVVRLAELAERAAGPGALVKPQEES